MASSNRAAIYSKTYRFLKKYYKPISPPSDRSVLENLMYACCLEDAHYEQADSTFDTIRQSYFDWNEVRVTTVKELSEVMCKLPDPEAAATTLKQMLQSMFESTYSFDLDWMRKQNIGKSSKSLSIFGATPFVVSYVTQCALGGHSIPIGGGELHALTILGAISPEEAEKRRVPGLEKTISKKKGIEFSSLLHQLSADLVKSPFSPVVRGIFIEIIPDAKQRLPKRKVKKTPSTARGKTTAKKKKTAKKGEKTAKKGERKKVSAGQKKKTVKPAKKQTTAAKKSKKKTISSRISKRKPR